jgi:hypothetical protein
MYAVGITLKELFTRSGPFAEYEEFTSEGITMYKCDGPVTRCFEGKCLQVALYRLTISES